MTSNTDKKNKLHQGWVWLVGLVILGVLLGVAHDLHKLSWSEQAVTILIGIAGAMIGGLVGSLASPASSKENKQFKQYVLVL